MTNEIVVELKVVSDQKSRKSKATVTLDTTNGELTLDHLSVIHQDGKSPWVAYPTIDFPDRETGEYRHLNVIIPGRRLKKAISDAVLAKYNMLSESDVPS